MYGMLMTSGTRRRVVLASISVVVIGGACRDAPVSSDAGLFFSTTKSEQSGAMMEALYSGPLVVKDDCVLIGRPGEYSLPVWWKGFTAARDRSGRVIVRNAEGMTIAIEGEPFEMGGGYVAEFYPGEEPRDVQVRRIETSLGYSIPERCLGPDAYGIWLVGETDPLASSPSQAS